MYTYDKFIKALRIFGLYPHTQDISAEHDAIYAGPDPEFVSVEHIKELEELGWVPSEHDCFEMLV